MAAQETARPHAGRWCDRNKAFREALRWTMRMAAISMVPTADRIAVGRTDSRPGLRLSSAYPRTWQPTEDRILSANSETVQKRASRPSPQPKDHTERQALRGGPSLCGELRCLAVLKSGD